MATYKEILGTAVQNFSSDPPSPDTGQVWYNSTAGQFKYKDVITAGAWATGGNTNVGRGDGAGFGTQTASLFVGGSGPTQPPTTFFAINESYNGTTWTELADLNTARQACNGRGNNTAGLVFGGQGPGSGPPFAYVGDTENWNGSSWTELNNLNTARGLMGASGATNTSALAFGGAIFPVPSSLFADNESWNGTSWTELNSFLFP